MERETKERPKLRVPKKAAQVGEEESSLGDAPRAEAELKELRKSTERLDLRKPSKGEGFHKILGFQEETGNFRKRELPDHAMVRGRLLLKVWDSVA